MGFSRFYSGRGLCVMEDEEYEEDEIEERYEQSVEYSDWQDYISMHC